MNVILTLLVSFNHSLHLPDPTRITTMCCRPHVAAVVEKRHIIKKKKHHSNYHDQQKQLEAVSGEGRVTDEEKSEKEGSVSYTVLQIHHSLHRQKQ